MSTSSRAAAIPAAMALAACSFSPTGGAGAGDDVGPRIDAAEVDGAVDAPIDAPTDAAIDACLPVCVNNTIESCGAVIETCAIGCSTTGTVHCQQIVASNGVNEADDLAGTDLDIVLEGGRLYIFNTDTGEIRHFPVDGSGGGAPVRPGMAPGLEATSHIRFRTTSQPAPAMSVEPPQIGVFGMKSLTVPANTVLRPIGSRAAVLVARGAITVGGTIDVGGGRVQSSQGAFSVADPGPGGGRGALDAATLALGCAPAGNGARHIVGGNQNRDTGGGGGGFGTAGGFGGQANGTNAGGSAVLVGVLPTVCAQTNLVPLRGGSGGGAGQGLNDGGAGGGALQLTSYTRLELTAATLYAGGAGGDGSTDAAGGGGAGAGGGILLEAPAIVIAGGAVVATGGGGGAGVGNTAAGEYGQLDGSPADPTGNGGRGATGGGAGEVAANAGTGDVDGTGGGGGGAGVIHLRSVSAPTISGSPVIRPGAGTSTAVVTP